MQDQQYWSKESRRLEAKFDLSPAKEFGELVFLLGNGATPFSSEAPIAELSSKLADYSDDDYLLLIGNPCLIGFTVAIAADANNGRVRLLQWSGKEQRYLKVEANLFPDFDD